MTRLRHLVIGGLAALAMAGVTSAAFAESPVDFQNRLQGATIGLPLGAAAPPGLYTGIETAYLGQANALGLSGGAATGNWAKALGGTGTVGLPTIAQAVPLLWSTGWHFLGANFSMAVVQAFYEDGSCTTALVPEGCANGTMGFVYANTTWTPIALSWNLGGGWFAGLGFNFMAPDGSHYGAAGVVQPNPDFWTLEPTFAIAYLSHNWMLAGNFFYDVNTQSTGECCLAGITGNPQLKYNNGNLFYGDLTALYKWGKWSVGPVGFFEVQTTADSVSGPGGAAFCATYCGNWSNVGVGGLVGYDFGPVDLQVWFTDVVESQNSAVGVGGFWVWSRFSFRIWAPEARPLVAKN